MAQQKTGRTGAKRRGGPVGAEQLRAAREWLGQVRKGDQPDQGLGGALRAALGPVLEQDFPRYSHPEQDRILVALHATEPRAWTSSLERLLREGALSYHVRLAIVELFNASDIEVGSEIVEPLTRAQALETRIRERLGASEGALGDWQDLLQELSALPTPLATEVIRAVGDIPPALPFLQALAAQNDPRLLPATVEILGTIAAPETAALLGQIAATAAAKDLQKSARRALYRLKSMGIDTQEALPQEPRKSVLDVPKLPVVAALASHIDFDGSRILYLARRRPFSGLVFVTLLVNDQHGVRDCHALPVTKKDLARVLEDIRAEENLTHVELPPSYAQQLVEEGYQRNLATGTPIPQDFLGLRDLIGRPDTHWEQPPIYHVLNIEELRGQPIFASLTQRLFGLKEFRGWYLSPDVLQPYREEIRRVAESPILVSQALQQERIDAIHKKAIREIWQAEACARYRRRLEEMAYILWHTRRPEEAKHALVAALGFQGYGIDPAAHPFLQALFRRSLEAANVMEEQEAGRVRVASPRLWTP